MRYNIINRRRRHRSRPTIKTFLLELFEYNEYFKCFYFLPRGFSINNNMKLVSVNTSAKTIYSNATVRFCHYIDRESGCFMYQHNNSA